MSGTSTSSLSFVRSISSSRSARIGLHAKGDVGVFGGVSGDLVDGDFVHAFLVAAFADELVDFDRGVVEVALGQVIEVVAAAAGVEEVVGDHGVES